MFLASPCTECNVCIVVSAPRRFRASPTQIGSGGTDFGVVWCPMMNAQTNISLSARDIRSHGLCAVCVCLCLSLSDEIRIEFNCVDRRKVSIFHPMFETVIDGSSISTDCFKPFNFRQHLIIRKYVFQL